MEKNRRSCIAEISEPRSSGLDSKNLFPFPV